MSELPGAVVREPEVEGKHRDQWAILALLSIAQLMVVLDATIVNIALPAAQNSLHFSTDSREWIITAYALAFGSLLLLGGKLGDLFGRKWTFIAGLCGFSIASAIGGLAQTFYVLVAARALQGAFGALLAPSALSLLTVTFAGSPDRSRAFGIFGAVAGGGASLGLLLGGVLTQELSWRWCLYVNLAIAIPTVIVGLRLLVNHSDSEHARVDLPGGLTSAAGVFALVYGFSNAETHSWAAPATIISLALSPILIGAFVVFERRSKDPLLPLHIVLDRARGGSYVAVTLVGAALFGVFLFLTYYLQQSLRFSPLTAGFAFMPLTAAVVVASTTVQTRVDRIGVRLPVVAGMALGLASMIFFTRLTPGASYAGHVLPGLIVLGVGMGFIFAPAFSAATLGVDGSEAGVASAMVNTSQQVGGSVGTALLSTVFASAVASYATSHHDASNLAGAAAVHGYTTAFWWSAGIFALGAGLGLIILPGRTRPKPATLQASLARLAVGNCHHVEAAALAAVSTTNPARADLLVASDGTD